MSVMARKRVRLTSRPEVLARRISDRRSCESPLAARGRGRRRSSGGRSCISASLAAMLPLRFVRLRVGASGFGLSVGDSASLRSFTLFRVFSLADGVTEESPKGLPDLPRMDHAPAAGNPGVAISAQCCRAHRTWSSRGGWPIPRGADAVEPEALVHGELARAAVPPLHAAGVGLSGSNGGGGRTAPSAPGPSQGSVPIDARWASSVRA
jgi:hypothetical protein